MRVLNEKEADMCVSVSWATSPRCFHSSSYGVKRQRLKINYWSQLPWFKSKTRKQITWRRHRILHKKQVHFSLLNISTPFFPCILEKPGYTKPVLHSESPDNISCIKSWPCIYLTLPLKYTPLPTQSSKQSTAKTKYNNMLLIKISLENFLFSATVDPFVFLDWNSSSRNVPFFITPQCCRILESKGVD